MTSEIRIDRKRISWSAIFAGVLTILVLQLFFGLIGFSLGIGSINPAEEQRPFSGLGAGMITWFGLTGIITLFVGGWVAARLSGLPNRWEGAMQGAFASGLAMIVMVFVVSTTVGGTIRSMAGLTGDIVSAVGRGAGSLVKEGVEAVAPEGLDMTAIKAEARSLLKQTGKPELQPKRLERSLDRATADAKSSVESAAKDPQTAGEDIEGLLDRVFASAEKTLSAIDKEAMVNVLVARTDMSREEAGRTVDRWEQTIQEGKMKLEATAGQAKAKAVAAAQSATDTASEAAAWFAGLMLIEIIIAALGGFLGSPRDPDRVYVGAEEDVSGRSAA